MLTTTTDSPQALEAATRGLEAIERFLTGNHSALSIAKAAMGQAHRADSQYYLPLYYLALIDYLDNRFDDAAEKFGRIAQDMPDDPAGIKGESAHNAGFAFNSKWVHDAGVFRPANLFHDTSRETTSSFSKSEQEPPLLERALQVRDSTADPAPDNPGLLDADGVKRADFHAQINEAISDAQKIVVTARELLGGPSKGIEPAIRREQAEKPLAIALDALARARMRLTDYFGDAKTNISTLKNKALMDLKEADKLFPKDWIIYSDLGACYLRLGHWDKNYEQFEIAREYLYDVCGTFGLKPRYDVAFFQIGRTYRLERQFKMAMRYFNRALKARETGSISGARIEREIRLAQEESTAYP